MPPSGAPSVAAIGATSSRIQLATASAIVQRRVAAGVMAIRTLSLVMTAERRTGSSIPQPLAPVTGGNTSITAMSVVIRNWHSLGPAGSAAMSGRGIAGRGRGRGMSGELAGMLGRKGGSGTRSLACALLSSRNAAARATPASRRPRQRMVWRLLKAVASVREDWSCVEGIPISRTNNADPRHSVRQGRHVGGFPAHLGSGHPHGDFGAFQRRCRGLRAPCRRQSLRFRAAAFAPRLAGGDRDNVRIRQIVGAGTRHSGHA